MDSCKSKFKQLISAAIAGIGIAVFAACASAQTPGANPRFYQTPHPALKADRNAALQAAAEAHAEIEKAVANATNAKDLSYAHFTMAGLLALRAQINDRQGALQTAALYINVLTRIDDRLKQSVSTRRNELDWVIRRFRAANMPDIADRLIKAQMAQLKSADNENLMHAEYYALAESPVAELVEAIGKTNNLLRRCNMIEIFSAVGRDDAVQAILRRFGIAGFTGQLGTCTFIGTVFARLTDFSLAQQMEQADGETNARLLGQPPDIEFIEGGLYATVRSRILLYGPGGGLLDNVRAIRTRTARHKAAMILALGYLRAADVAAFERVALDPSFWDEEEKGAYLYSESENLACFLIHLGRTDLIRTLVKRSGYPDSTGECYSEDVKLAFAGNFRQSIDFARRSAENYFNTQPNGKFELPNFLAGSLTNIGFIASGDPRVLRPGPEN
jgi:hypothetical protein